MSNKAIEPKLEDYFDGCLYFSLSRLQRKINKMAEDAFEQSGLAPSHAFILMALHESESLTAGALADLVGLAPSTVTRFIDKLEKNGLCRRNTDGRIVYVSITKKGQKLMPEIQAAWKSLFNAYNEAYGAQNADKLNKMIVNLNAE